VSAQPKTLCWAKPLLTPLQGAFRIARAASACFFNPMIILRAQHLGMCFGVRDAIALAFQQSSQGPLTILGDLVHNDVVLAALRHRGVQVERDPGQIATRHVMVTAHGASDIALQRLRSTGLKVSEATCPLVHHAHAAVKRLVQQGYHPVVIGQRDHVEVRGLTEDLTEFDVVLTEEDVHRMKPRARIGIAAQTTQPIKKVEALVQLIREQFAKAEVKFEDTVCQPTKQRQWAAVDLARQADVMVVVGGAHSNNTKELVATCSALCRHVFHVQSKADLRAEWFRDAQVVGVTAGTSTPDLTIDGVEQWLRELASRPILTPASCTETGAPGGF
jgi:4-hydroxy-3-methylbut-2-enyl diphosphate reductase